MTKAIISYDGSPTDQDALALGRLLAESGLELLLVYVRHSTEDEHAREQLEERDARALLERGARWLGEVEVEQRVVISGSTAEGLARLAEEEGANVIGFGSGYRTSPRHIAPQKSTRTPLEGGSTAVAVAPAR